MDNTEKMYKNLTGIDLDEQRKIWDERGKGYYGEYCVFRELFLNIPGPCKFLMNLHIPTEQNRSTEIDLLMIHETGIYVFEIKHYKGIIYGNTDDSIWTQFFKTTKNYVFENPVHQNGYHIRALKQQFTQTPMHSVIVFSNKECDVRVQNSNPNLLISSVTSISNDLRRYIALQRSSVSVDNLEAIFNALLPYSALRGTDVASPKNEAVPFYSYVDEVVSLRSKLESTLTNKQTALEEKERKLEEKRKSQRTHWWLTFIAATLCLILVFSAISQYFIFEAEQQRLEMEQKLHAMEENFKHVDYLNDNNLKFVHTAIQVSNIKLTMSPDLQNTALFACSLTNNAEYYGIMFNKDSKYIIQKTDGTVLEYDMFGERLKYSEAANKLAGSAAAKWYSQTGTLKELEIYDINDVSEIEYIKITKVSIWKYGENSNKALINNLVLRVYSKSGD